MKKIIFILLLLFFAWPAHAYYDLGQPLGFVNDYGDMMSRSEEELLENKLLDFERKSSNEIVIVTIPNLKGDTIENFAVKLFNDWRIGKEKNDNGVLILVSRDDKQMRIEVGYGLEGALTDAQSYWIINDILKVDFQKGNYYTGFDHAIDKIISATQGEYLPSRESVEKKSNFNFEFLFWIGIFVFMWLASVLGRSKSWWAGGVLGGIAGVIVTLWKGFLYNGMISLAVLVPLGFIFDFIVSRSYHKHKTNGTIPWWIGGGRGGGFGSGGFGGFGGGSSGGGGASGNW